MSNVLNSLIEVKLNNPDDFLKVKETLQRIGVASKKDNVLYQSCHILHKQGRYYITHFKELFALDGKSTDFSENDMARRNTIINLLNEWGLVTLVDPVRTSSPTTNLSQIKVISYKNKSLYRLESKYNIGKH